MLTLIFSHQSFPLCLSSQFRTNGGCFSKYKGHILSVQMHILNHHYIFQSVCPTISHYVLMISTFCLFNKFLFGEDNVILKIDLSEEHGYEGFLAGGDKSHFIQLRLLDNKLRRHGSTCTCKSACKVKRLLIQTQKLRCSVFVDCVFFWTLGFTR